MERDRVTQPRRNILFVTGTRADFGKLKPLIRAVADSPRFDYTVFVTGMHTLGLYGVTGKEVEKAGFRNIHFYMNQIINEPMDMILANSVTGMARFVHETPPDMIVVHGDRVEALAGAIVGALRNILVCHIEGGELSGTIDGLIRHATSKMSHLHFVANEEAARRLAQLGEAPQSIFVIGSPDIDIMASPNLPPIEATKTYYDIIYDRYGIVLFHPVTTEVDCLRECTRNMVDALLESGRDYIVIYPNNDEGTGLILDEYRRLRGNPRFRIFPSIRFEFFLTLLKHADLIVGNSSAGIREAPFYGLPTVNIGTRQDGRYNYRSIINAGYDKDAILSGIRQALERPHFPPNDHFGCGDSVGRFMAALNDETTWTLSRQKQFVDLPSLQSAVKP